MRGHCVTRGHSCMVSGRNKVEITQSDTGRVENKKWLNQRLEGARPGGELELFKPLRVIAPLSLLALCWNTVFLSLQLFWSKFFRENCGGIRCKRDWGRRWGRWEVELRGVMDERERWEETRRTLGVVSSASSYCSDREYRSLVEHTSPCVTAGEASECAAAFLTAIAYISLWNLAVITLNLQYG